MLTPCVSHIKTVEHIISNHLYTTANMVKLWSTIRYTINKSKCYNCSSRRLKTSKWWVLSQMNFWTINFDRTKHCQCYDNAKCHKSHIVHCHSRMLKELLRICGMFHLWKNHIEWLMYICITAHSLPEMTEFLLLHEGANYILTMIQLGFIGDFLWSAES